MVTADIIVVKNTWLSIEELVKFIDLMEDVCCTKVCGHKRWVIDRRGGSGASSKTRAVLIAGYNDPAYVTTIDYAEIMTTGDFIDFGDAPARAFGASGVASNGHGGLG